MTNAGPTIELWLADLEPCADHLAIMERAIPRLTPDDRARADAVRDPRERRHRLAAYGALRVLLERIAGPGVRGRPFIRASGGKPRLDLGNIEFSLSHVDGLALIGVSSGSPLGVDLEKLRPVKMAQRRLLQLCAAGAGLGSRPLSKPGGERAFLQAWARLEAFAKARGRGLERTLIDIGVRGGEERRPEPEEIEARARRMVQAERLVVHDIALSPALHGALCAPLGTRPLKARSFPTDRGGIEQLVISRS